MLHLQIFNSYAVRLQTLNIPHGESRLFESAGLGPVISLAPILRTNESAESIVQRDRHSFTPRSGELAPRPLYFEDA